MAEGLVFNSTITIAAIIFLAPLISAIFLTFIPEKQQRPAALASALLMVFIAVLSLYNVWALWGGDTYHARVNWFELGNGVKFTAGMLINIEAGLMMSVVTIIASLVAIYSLKYMEGDGGFLRYFIFMNAFVFSMLGIVVADNLLLIFIFWELVGLCSYLLIGFWYNKKSASYAAQKAFVVNRIGDAGFLIGLSILWVQFNTLDLQQLQALVQASHLQHGIWVSAINQMDITWLSIAGIGLFLGAVGKSAQFPLQVWLPDAMEGPTPVSALIHAATMVAAGVYLMIRVFALLDITALMVIAYVGAITAFMGAVAALVQHDIKKVLAYSTISQLGYMLMGIGVGAYDAAYFHLFTHAFFKACLFLCAGSVSYALHKYARKHNVPFDAQDMRNMGGLSKYMPVTFVAYAIAAFALMGIPFFSGFLSKDALLAGAYAWADGLSENTISIHYLVPDLGFITIILTALYMVRQLLLVFLGDFRIAQQNRLSFGPVEVPGYLKYTTACMAFLSVGIIWSLNPLDFSGSWLLGLLEVPQNLTPGFSPGFQAALVDLTLQNHTMVSIISMTMALVGAAIATYIYRPGTLYASSYFSRPVAGNFLQRLSYYNWYLDPFYYYMVQQPVIRVSEKLQWIEKRLIDQLIDKFAVLNVVIAHTFAWLDKYIIDGIVRLIVYISGLVGQLVRKLHGSQAQSFVVIGILALLIIIWLIV